MLTVGIAGLLLFVAATSLPQRSTRFDKQRNGSTIFGWLTWFLLSSKVPMSLYLRSTSKACVTFPIVRLSIEATSPGSYGTWQRYIAQRRSAST
jgi:hypothetical protein